MLLFSKVAERHLHVNLEGRDPEKDPPCVVVFHEHHAVVTDKKIIAAVKAHDFFGTQIYEVDKETPSSAKVTAYVSGAATTATEPSLEEAPAPIPSPEPLVDAPPELTVQEQQALKRAQHKVANGKGDKLTPSEEKALALAG